MDHTYTFRWDMREHVRAHRAVTKHMSGGGWLRAMVGFVPVLIFVAIVAMAVGPAEGRLQRLIAIAPWILILACWFAFLVWGLAWVGAWRLKRQDPAVQHEMLRAVGPSGLRVGGSTGVLDLNWTGIQRIVETPEFLLFYYSKQCAHYVPKRIVPKADLPALRALLREYMGTKACLETSAQAAA